MMGICFGSFGGSLFYRDLKDRDVDICAVQCGIERGCYLEKVVHTAGLEILDISRGDMKTIF